MIVIKNGCDPTERSQIKLFLRIAGKSLNNFRYFANKSDRIFENHLMTCLYYDPEKGIPVGYAHLDFDEKNTSVWFGICVAEKYVGRGIGKQLVEFTLAFAKKQNLEKIFLSVDLDNEHAQKLYEKFGFQYLKQNKTKNAIYMCWERGK